MKRLLFILFALQSIASYGQMFTITVKDAATKISLQGASVTILDKDSLKEIIPQLAKIRGWKTLVINYLFNVIFRSKFR